MTREIKLRRDNRIEEEEEEQYNCGGGGAKNSDCLYLFHRRHHIPLS